MFRVIAPLITDRGPPGTWDLVHRVSTVGICWEEATNLDEEPTIDLIYVEIWMHLVGTLEGDRGRSWNIWNDIWKLAHDLRLFRLWIHRFMKDTLQIWWTDIQNDDPDTVMPCNASRFWLWIHVGDLFWISGLRRRNDIPSDYPYIYAPWCVCSQPDLKCRGTSG